MKNFGANVRHTHTEIAKALGLSRTAVQIAEYNGLLKIAKGLDLPLPVRPRWMTNPKKHNRCSICFETGHNIQKCPEKEAA